jgi:hypothetical protein
MEFSEVSLKRYCRLDPAMVAELSDVALREDVAREAARRLGERIDRALCDFATERDQTAFGVLEPAAPAGETWSNRNTTSASAITLEDIERTFRKAQAQRFPMPPIPPPELEPLRLAMYDRFRCLHSVLPMSSVAWDGPSETLEEWRLRLEGEYSDWRREQGLDPTLTQIDQFEEWACALAERDDMPLLAHGEEVNDRLL